MNPLRMIREWWTEASQPRKIKLLRLVAFVCYSFALLFFVIYVFGGTRRRVSDPSRVVVFAESSPAGIMALRHLAKRADVSIAMIVLAVDAWSFNFNAAHDNTVAFLATLRAAGELRYDVPVYYGNSVAQVNARFDDEVTFAVGGGGKAPNTTSCTYRRVIKPDLMLQADSLFGASKLLDTVPLPAPTSHENNNTKNKARNSGARNDVRFVFFDAPLADYLSRHTATFLVLGPSTDAAYFLQRHTELREKVSQIIVAGGVVSKKGNTHLVYPPNLRSEQHMFFDPHAANYLVSRAHGRPVELLTLDVSPQWPQSLYESLILSRASSPTSPSSTAVSARVVALAIVGFNRWFKMGEWLPVEVVAAMYFADHTTRHGAEVAGMSLLVANGVAMATDGMLGTPNGTRGEEELRTRVVMRVREGPFWSRLEGVDRLGS